MAYTKYSLTPADNNAAPPNGAPEGMLPSGVNDTMRDMMSQIRDVGDGIRGGTYTMTAPVITGGSITGSTINNSAIGGTTAAAGKFTTLEATGVTTVQAGTASAPAITTTGDTNTGIFFPAADAIGLAVGGVEAARLVSGLLSVPANSTAPSAIRLSEDADNGTNYVDLIAPAAITSNRTLTIPDETGTIITTASSGQSIPSAALPAGSVLQVLQTVKTDAFSTTSTTMVDVTGLSATITPKFATSKILIQLSCVSTGGRTNIVTMFTQILRNSTFIYDSGNGLGAPADDQPAGLVATYLDSPATTSATTYKLQIRGDGAIVGINRTASSASTCGSSSITIMEIAA